MANANVMSGSLDAIINERLSEQSKVNPALAKAMASKKMSDCVAAIYNAFSQLAMSKGMSGGVALSGDDALIASAAIHWFTEEKPTVESIVEILKGGTQVKSMSVSKAEGQEKSKVEGQKSKAEPAPKSTSKSKSEPKPESTSKSEPAPSPKPEPPKMEVVVPITPAPAVEEDDDDDDFDPLS